MVGVVLMTVVDDTVLTMVDVGAAPLLDEL